MVHLARTVNAFSQTYGLLSPGDGVVVGVSGGPDSRVLLDVLSRLSAKYALDIRVAHVNYGLRGTESDEDEAFVRNLAREYGYPVSVKRVRSIAQRGDMENRLRDIRYRFFEQVRARYGLRSVAVGHTRDDQAETLLLHLLRGSGLRGLRGMLPRNGTVIRPLLGIGREDVLGYCRRYQLPYRTDSSNRDVRFVRNRVRHRLLPYLERNFNPAIRRTLARTATLVGEEYVSSGMDGMSDTPRGGSRRISLSLGELRVLPIAECRRRLAGVAGALGITLGFAQYEELLKVIRSAKVVRSTFHVGRLKVSRKNDTLTLFRNGSGGSGSGRKPVKPGGGVSA